MPHGDVSPAESAPRYAGGNRLLDALPAFDRADLAADLDIITIEAHKHTHAVGAVIRHVDFPIDAVLSVVSTLQNGESMEVGTVGRESFVEYDVVLASIHAQRSSFCQVRGTLGRMPIERFTARMTNSATFARLMHLNVRATLFSAQQYAACNGKHSVVERSARWLAMTADRVGAPEFKLTNAFLAIMLGARPVRVADATDTLRASGIIAYERGDVTILDIDRLRAAACECYAACAAAFSASLHE